MELLQQEQAIRQEIFRYFGYLEDWCIFPLYDSTDCHWILDDDSVAFAESPGPLLSEEGDFWVNTIYRQRFLSKWVYEGPEYTMILVDTHCDGNKYLQIFDNSKRLTR